MTIDREPIYCTEPGCIDTGCQAVLMEDGRTVVLANLVAQPEDIAASGLWPVLQAHPNKGLLKGNIDLIYQALGELIARRGAMGDA